MKTAKKIDIHTLQKLNAEAAMTSSTIPTKKLLPPLNPKLLNKNRVDEKETEESDVRYYLELSTTDYDDLDLSPLPSSLKPTQLLKNQPKFRHLLNTPVISIITENTTTTHTSTASTTPVTSFTSTKPSTDTINHSKSSLPTTELKSAELDQLDEINVSKSFESMDISTHGLLKTSSTNQTSNMESMVTNDADITTTSTLNVPIPTITPPYPSKKAVLLRWDGSYDEIDYVTHLPESQRTSMIELILGSSPQVIGDLESLGTDTTNTVENSKKGKTVNDNDSDNSDDSDFIEDNSEEVVEMKGDKYTLHLVCSNQDFSSAHDFGININNLRLNRHSLPFPFNRETIRGDILVYKTKNDEFGTNGNNIVDLTMEEYVMFLTEQTMLANDIMFGQEILSDNKPFTKTTRTTSTSTTEMMNSQTASNILNSVIDSNKYDDIDISILSSDDEKNARLQEISPLKYAQALQQAELQSCNTVRITDISNDCTVSTARRTLIPSDNLLSNTTVTTHGGHEQTLETTLPKNTKTKQETLLVLKSTQMNDTDGCNGDASRQSIEQSPDKVSTSVTSENGDFTRESTRDRDVQSGNANKIRFIGGVNGVMTDIIDISDIILEFDDVSSASEPEEIIVNQDCNLASKDGDYNATINAVLDDIILQVCKDMKSQDDNNDGVDVACTPGMVKTITNNNTDIDARLQEIDSTISRFEKDYMDALAYTKLIAAAQRVSDGDSDDDVDTDRSDEKLEYEVNHGKIDKTKMLDNDDHQEMTEMKDLQSEELLRDVMNDDDMEMDIVPLDISETRKEISDILSKIEMKVDDKIRQALELGETKKESDLVNDVCKDVSYIHSIVKQSYQQILNGNSLDDKIGDNINNDQSSEYSDDFETESLISEKKEESVDVSEVVNAVHSIGVSTYDDHDNESSGKLGFMERKCDAYNKSDIKKDHHSSKDLSHITETKLQQMYQGFFEKDINTNELQTLMLMVKKV